MNNKQISSYIAWCKSFVPRYRYVFQASILSVFFLALVFSCNIVLCDEIKESGNRSGVSSEDYEKVLKSVRKSSLQKKSTQIPEHFDILGDYCIGPEDVLEISVYDEPDLTRTVRVNPDGAFSYPLLGRVEVAGLSVSRIENKIIKLLDEGYLVNPQVSVFVKQYRSKKVFILGCVEKPGEYDLKGEKVITIVQAISMAGGFTKIASPDKTRIIRIDNNKKKVIQVKISDITHKGDKSKDVVLKPMDIVFVPESFF